MENGSEKKLVNKGIRAFFIAFTSVVTIGLFSDIILKQNLHKTIDILNIVGIAINSIVLFGFFRKRIDVRLSFAIVAYFLVFNSLISSTLNMFLSSGLEIFMRDSIFLIILIVFSAFIIGRFHALLLSGIYISYLLGYTFISNNPFLLNNFSLIAFVYIMLGLMLYFLKTVFDSTINETEQLLSLLKNKNTKIEDQNMVLKDQAFELTTLNDALVSKKEILNAQKEDLQKVNLTKDKLFSIVAHDLKDLVGSIHGSSRYLEDKFLDMDDLKRFQFVSIINESSLKLSELLENLLQWSRAQSNKISITKDKLNLYRVVNKVIEPNTMRAFDKNISLTNSIPKDSITEGDAQLLFIVFHNLISNAIKFTAQGGKIMVTLTDFPDYQLIEITDNGVGMEIEKYDSIFELKPGENQMGTTGEKGTGLGLTLCKEFVEMHGGKIGAKSNKSKGSIFWFSLPKSTSEAN